MYPILGRYGPFFLYSYTVCLSLGILTGMSLAYWQSRRYDLSFDWLDGVLAALAAGLVGGRVGFVWGAWSYFQERPSQILQFQQGGLSYHGALLAGLVGLWGWCVWQRRPLLPIISLLAPSIALANVFGWFACWLEGCAYGREAAAGHWLAAGLPDTFGIFAWRYQTQLLGVGVSLLIFVWVMWRQRHWSASQTAWLTLLAISLSRAGINLLRGDIMPLFSGIRIDILIDLALAILFLLLLKYTEKPAKFFKPRQHNE